MPATPGGETDTDMEAVPSSTAPVTATAMVRVPAQLVDDLLRLLGETIILSERIQERLDVTANETQSLRMNIENHLGALRDMLSDQGLLNRESQ